MKKKITISVISVLVVLVLIYIGISLYLSISIKNLIYDINNSDREYHSVHILNDEVAGWMRERNIEDFTEGELAEYSADELRDEFTVYPVWVNLFHQTANFRYTYNIYDKNGDMVSGSEYAAVDLKFKFENFNWVIIDKEEGP